MPSIIRMTCVCALLSMASCKGSDKSSDKTENLTPLTEDECAALNNRTEMLRSQEFMDRCMSDEGKWLARVHKNCPSSGGDEGEKTSQCIKKNALKGGDCESVLKTAVSAAQGPAVLAKVLEAIEQRYITGDDWGSLSADGKTLRLRTKYDDDCSVPWDGPIKEPTKLDSHPELRMIYMAVREAYMNGAANNKTFPTESVGPTPETTAGLCCGARPCEVQEYEDGWNQPTWKSLGISIGASHFSFEYKAIDPEKKFQVIAYADWGCNGSYTTYTVTGEINDLYRDGPKGSPDVVVGTGAPR